MVHTVSLSVVLYVVWLLLSGYFEPLLLTLGAVSCGLVVWIAHRMDVVDREGHPMHLTWQVMTYWPWLAWQIVKSNVQVAKLIISPRLPISPKIIKVTTSQADELGQVIYANSITLTPGTVSLYLRGNTIGVHALTHEMADELETGEMDRWVTAMADQP